jgi:hypothetical protein
VAASEQAEDSAEQGHALIKGYGLSSAKGDLTLCIILLPATFFLCP